MFHLKLYFLLNYTCTADSYIISDAHAATGGGSSHCTHLGCEVHISTEYRFEPLSLFEEFGHGPVILTNIVLALLLLVEQFGQMVPESQVHLKATQPTVEPRISKQEKLSLTAISITNEFNGY